MRHGRGDHAASNHISCLKIVFASAGLLAVVLFTLRSIFEAADDIRETGISKNQFLKQNKGQQHHFSDFYNGEDVASTSTARINSDYVQAQLHDTNLSHPTTTVNSSTVQFHSYKSMFSTPAADWKRKDTDIVADTSQMLRVYVYDSLPVKYTESVTSCIMELAGVNNSTVFSSLSTKMADIAIIKLFETYPGRVYNPNGADIFVVPYAHTAHCYCASGWEKACAQVNDTEISELFESLSYYNASTMPRHLFVLSGIQYFLNDRFTQQPLKLVGGNLSPLEVTKKKRGTIVIPYLNDKYVFQKIFTVPNSWWTRPRQYAFSFVFGRSNKRNKGYDPRKIRKHFEQNWLRRNRTELGGLPVYIYAFDDAVMAPIETMWNAFDRYQDSIFCPILAGDSCQQARFFDAMLSGCIPVVLSFTTTDVSDRRNSWASNLTSWYKEGGETTAAVYPFHISLVDFGIDYDNCVLAVPAKVQRDVRKLVNVMESIILHNPAKILQWQTNLKDCATRTAFGLAENSHRYNDAFAQIIRMLRYYLDEEMDH